MDPVVIVVQPVTLAVAVPAVPAPTVTLGAQGPMGPSHGYFEYTQATASDTWVIAHNLGFFPNVTIVDSSGREIEGDIHYIDTNNITIYFTAAFAGQAFLG